MTSTKRAPKFVAKPTIVGGTDTLNTPFSETPDVFGASARELWALVAGLTLSGSTTYIGLAMSNVIGTAAMVLTGSVFIGFVIYFVGAVLSMMAAIAAGTRLQRMIVDGSLDRKVGELGDNVVGAWQSASRSVSGWFA
jgi:hypothetical protein